MTPENIAGFTIPQEQLQDLIDALAQMHVEPNVVAIRPELSKAA